MSEFKRRHPRVVAQFEIPCRNSLSTEVDRNAIPFTE